MKKRLLSIILAITVIATLLPAMALSAGAENTAATEYTYNFGTDSGVSSNTPVTEVTIYVSTGSKWKYATNVWDSNNNTIGNTVKKSDIKSGYMRVKTAAVGSWLALKMEVEESGWYEIQFSSYRREGYGGIGDVYLLPTGNIDDSSAKIEAALSGSDVITVAKDVKYCDISSGSGPKNEASVVSELTAEEYYIVFKVTGQDSAITNEALYMYPASLTLTPLTAQEKADAAFITDDNKEENISYTASDLKGLTIDGDVIDGEPNGDGSYNLTAPEENKAGYEFVYWAKGNVAKKRILLYQTNELKNYVPDESGVTYLIPVYEDMLPTTDEYYNANGQLIPDAKDSDRPYMAGYGNASGWNRYGNTNIYVAEYNNKTQPDDVTVTVANGTGTATVPYGDPVICTADESTYGTFRWWQKEVNGVSEIVSVDESYSFLAYENCEVTAVYGDSGVSLTNPTKIIIDTFGENSVMAEFIGFGNNVVEKGIMWNNNKIAMTAPGNQFTVTADKVGTNTFVGYAIVGNATDGYTLITDGEAKITIAE